MGFWALTFRAQVIQSWSWAWAWALLKEIFFNNIYTSAVALPCQLFYEIIYLFIYFYLYLYFYNKKIDSALYYVFERVYYFKFNFMKGEYP